MAHGAARALRGQDAVSTERPRRSVRETPESVSFSSSLGVWSRTLSLQKAPRAESNLSLSLSLSPRCSSPERQPHSTLCEAEPSPSEWDDTWSEIPRLVRTRVRSSCGSSKETSTSLNPPNGISKQRKFQRSSNGVSKPSLVFVASGPPSRVAETRVAI